MHKSLRAFTLIEMLVVMSIMMILSSMIMLAYEGSDADAVTADSYELQTVLQRARSLTLSSGRSHAVAFHIENAGDGSVLKNHSDNDAEDFPGRHWYAIIGPDNSNRSRDGAVRSTKRPPIIGTNGSNALGGYRHYNFFTITEYGQALEDMQVGPRHYLSKGVRFLALTDTDTLYYQESDSSYPRPWFGHYDDTTNTYYPWGAYNREIDVTFTHPNTGLDYEGLNGVIPYDATLDCNVYPPQVWGRIHYTHDYPSGTGTGGTAIHPGHLGVTDTAVLEHFGKAGEWVGPDTTLLPGQPKPLINGYWADFMILFAPDGSASMVTAHCRAVYLSRGSWGRATVEGSAQPGMTSEVDRTGGYSITLCRDVDPNDLDLYRGTNAITGQPAYNQFNSVEDAFESINPFLRVFINKLTGIAEVQNNEHPYMRISADDLLQHDPYPRGL